MVQHRRARAKGGEQRSHDAECASARPTSGMPARPRWSDAESENELDDEMEQVDGGADWEGDEDEAADAVGSDDPDPRQLRASFEELAKAVRSLERRSEFSQEGTALRALREARDRAESAWRAAKAPAPLPTRMAWAEEKLERAATALTKARLAVEELDEEYDRRREALCRKVEEADAWRKWRQQQVDALHCEAAEKIPSGRKGQASQGGLEVRDKIRCQLLPELQAIMEHVEGNPEILEKLSLLAAGLVDAESCLGNRHGSDATETYDMADGDSEKGAWGAATDVTMDQGTAADGQGGARTMQVGGKGKPTEWKAEGGRWTRAAAASKTGDTSAEDSRQVTAAGAAPHGGGRPEAGAHDDARGFTAGGTAGAGGQGAASGSVDAPAGSDDEREKPPKHRCRRSEAVDMDEAREASDRKRAEELHAQQAAAAAAQIESFNAGTGGFGSEAALSLAAQRYVVEVQNVQRRAARQGVEPRTDDGRTLLQLSPMELQKWAETNLGGEEEY